MMLLHVSSQYNTGSLEDVSLLHLQTVSSEKASRAMNSRNSIVRISSSHKPSNPAQIVATAKPLAANFKQHLI